MEDMFNKESAEKINTILNSKKLQAVTLIMEGLKIEDLAGIPAKAAALYALLQLTAVGHFINEVERATTDEQKDRAMKLFQVFSLENLRNVVEISAAISEPECQAN
jgi:hypothetical protein